MFSYVSTLIAPLQADLSVRNSAVVSLEQECQKLREELVVCKVNFEREVGSLKEELQKQKTALEVHKIQYM